LLLLIGLAHTESYLNIEVTLTAVSACIAARAAVHVIHSDVLKWNIKRQGEISKDGSTGNASISKLTRLYGLSVTLM
jgi:hypothetical protein